MVPAVSLEVCQQGEMPEGACTDSRPCQLEPFHPRNCNCGGCGCPVEERTHFGGVLAVVLILLIVLSTFCPWALGWTTQVELLHMGSRLASQFLKHPSSSTGSG